MQFKLLIIKQQNPKSDERDIEEKEVKQEKSIAKRGKEKQKTSCQYRLDEQHTPKETA